MAPNPLILPQNSHINSLTETDNSEIVVRTAWLYFMENMTQQEIAECLGISRIKVVRLIKEARENGIVEIKVHSPISENLKLEGELRSLYHLTNVAVTLPEEEGNPLNKVLAWTAAQIIEERMRPGLQVGIGIGRTTSFLPDYLAPARETDCTFISLAGGLTSRGNIEDSYATILKLARLTGGTAKYIYAPFLVSNSEIRDALLRDEAVDDVIKHARKTDLAVFSVGTPDDFALLHEYNLLTDGELSKIRSLGAVGDALGRFFDETGKEIITSYRERVIGLTIEELVAIPTRMLVAGGPKKYKAVKAALTGKIANILVTDITTAKWLINQARI